MWEHGSCLDWLLQSPWEWPHQQVVQTALGPPLLLAPPGCWGLGFQGRCSVIPRWPLDPDVVAFGMAWGTLEAHCPLPWGCWATADPS